MKRNQADLLEEMQTAFRDPACPPEEFEEPVKKAHGRIERRSIAVLPAEMALSPAMRREWPWPGAVARIRRVRQHVRKGKVVRTEIEISHVITSLRTATPETILRLNRRRRGIEIMHRNRDVFLGEDGCTNRLGHVPASMFALIGAARTILKMIGKSPTRAIEMVQDQQNRAIRFLGDEAMPAFL